MKLQNHLGTISWTIANKLLYVIYGFIFLVQISILTPDDFALFSLLLAINTWIFIICDAFALQIIIQYGFEKNNEKQANTYSLILHITISMLFSLIVYFLGNHLSKAFNEPRFIEVSNYLPILSLLMIPRTYFSKFLIKNQNMKALFFVDLFFFGVFTFLILYYKFSQNSMTYLESVNIYFIGTTASSLIAFFLSKKYIIWGMKGDFKLGNILYFSVPYTLSNALMAIPRQLDIVILKLFFDLKTVGIYQAARSLFRLFEEGINAANTLIYPALVKHFKNGNKGEAYLIASKGISFTFITFVTISIILPFGVSEFLIKLFLKSTYLDSIYYFNVLLISSIFIPFFISYFVLTAADFHRTLLKNVGISVLISLICYYIIGILHNENLIPFAYISFFASLAILNYFVMKNKIFKNLRIKFLFRALEDSIGFIKKIKTSESETKK